MASPQVRRKIESALFSKPTDNVLTRKEGSTFTIVLNRPKRSNSFSIDMYLTVADAIRTANADTDVKFILIIGEGKNFSSGNDLSNFGNPEFAEFDIKEFVKFIACDVLESYGKALIESDKPIVAIVQGKIIGFAFTQLALCDRVYALEGSTLKAPLVKLAQGPEMCSAYTFPKIFGKKMADELIIGAKEIPVSEAEKYGLLEVCKDTPDALNRFKQYKDMIDGVDWTSFVEARRLMRYPERELLLKTNKLECDNLVNRWLNPELPALMMQYMASTKAKL